VLMEGKSDIYDSAPYIHVYVYDEVGKGLRHGPTSRRVGLMPSNVILKEPKLVP
jgi:hypothetical protein